MHRIFLLFSLLIMALIAGCDASPNAPTNTSPNGLKPFGQISAELQPAVPVIKGTWSCEVRFMDVNQDVTRTLVVDQQKKSVTATDDLNQEFKGDFANSYVLTLKASTGDFYSTMNVSETSFSGQGKLTENGKQHDTEFDCFTP